MKKRFLSLLVAMAMMMSLVPLVMPVVASADILDSGKCGDNVSYTLDSNGLLTISGTGDMYDWYLGTHTYDSYLPPWYNSSISSVVIGSGVTSVGDIAFINQTSLRNISIADSVTKIGEYAFKNTGYYNTASNWSYDILYIGNFLIDVADRTNTSYTIATNTRVIGKNAFNACTALTSISIPGNVQHINAYAFYNCPSLANISVSVNVKSVGESAFKYTAYYEDSSKWTNGLLYIGNYLIDSQSSIVSAVIPEGKTVIADKAFEERYNLTSITVPSTLKYIGYNAFYNCKNLENIYISDMASYLNIDFKNEYSSPMSCQSNVIPKLYLDNKRVTTLDIPSGVSKIPQYAFYRCDSIKTKTVAIPDSVKSIGKYAFSDCTGISSVTIGNGVETIDERAFAGCSEITELTIGNKVDNIGDYAFSYCSSLTDIIIPDSVEYVGEYAFSGCSNVESVTLGKGIEVVDRDAFWGCEKIDSVYISDLASYLNIYFNPYDESIGGEEFDIEGNRIYYFVIDGARNSSNPVSYASKLYLNNELVTQVDIPEGVFFIPVCAFNGLEDLESVTIPDSVQYIDNGAFSDCNKLTKVTVGKGVTDISSGAFSNSPYIGELHFHSADLTSVYVGGKENLVVAEVGDGTTHIDYGSFKSCSNLKRIFISDTVTEIEQGVFEDCTSLTDVYYSGSEEDWNEIYIGTNNENLLNANITYNSDFENNYIMPLDVLRYTINSDDTVAIDGFVDVVKEIEIPSTIEGLPVTAIDDSAFECSYYTNSMLESVNIPESITSIGPYAFSFCRSLKDITIPSSVTYIGFNAFSCCTSLEDITIPDSVTSIEDSTFEACTSLTNIKMPDSITSIGNSAFRSCRELKNITISNSVASIGRMAFNDCASLTEITIPKSVMSIEKSAFSDCTSLTDVYYGGTEAQWNSVTIEENNTSLLNATIHYNSIDDPTTSPEPTADPSPEPTDEPEPTVDPSMPTPVPAKPIMGFVSSGISGRRSTIGDTFRTSIYLYRGDYYNNGVLNISVDDEAFDLVSEDGFVVQYDNDEGVRTETTIPKTAKLTLDDLNENGSNIVITYTSTAAGSIYFSAEYTGENESGERYSRNVGGAVNIVTGAAAEMPEAENTEKLYYTLNGKNVNISLNGTVNFAETTDKNIVVVCYDNGALVKTAITPLGASVNGAELNDFTIELPSEPENLIVKAFAWSGFDKCTPLCNASELSDIPADAFKVKGRVTATSRSDWSVDNGRVIFRVEKSDNFDGEIIAKSYDCIEEDMYIGNTDIDRHLNEIVEAYVVKDANNEYKIIKYTPLYEEQTLTLTKSDIDLENSTESTLITTEGQDIDISSIEARYVNGVANDDFDNADLLSLITIMSEEYSKITLLDEYTVSEFESDGKYDEIYLDCYYEATIDEVKIPPFTMTDEETGEDYDVTDEIWVWFGNSDYPIDSNLHIYPYDDWYSYSFINENWEQCGVSELKKYEGKEIYIAFDVTEYFSDSRFYDVILEGAEADNTAVHENRLSNVNSTVVLRYSDTDNTAFLDGEMSFDGDGNMPFDMTVSYIKDNEVISSEIIKSNTLAKRLLFGYESGKGEDYTVTAKQLSFEEKPDKAVISFDEELGIDDINIPIVSKDAYKVCGRVRDTHKTDPEIPANEVIFEMDRTDNFEGEYWEYGGGSAGLYFGDTNAPDLLRIYSQAFITKNADGDYTIEAIMPFPVNSVTLSAENFDADKSSYYNNSLYFYQDGVSNNAVKYVLNDDFEVYVNGVYYSDISGSIDSLINYVDWHNTAKITLIKESSWGGSTSTRTYYNLVMIEDYSTAVVQHVTDNEGVYTIDFYDCSSDITSSMNIDTTDNEKSYSFKLGDSDIAFSDIKVGDVLSIAYDETGAFENSSFYDVLVSRDTASGMCTSSNSGNNEYTFNDVTYKTANGMDIAIEVGTEYTLYFDIFGRIALAAENYEPNPLAILKNVYKRANGDWYAQIITMEGKEEEYLIDERYATEYLSIIGAEDSFGVSYDYGEKLDKYPQQVVEYRLNSSSQKLRIINSVAGIVASDTQYEQSNSAIGDRIQFSADTVILDISDIENGNIKNITKDELVDGRYYTAFGYDHNWRAEEGMYRFVLITGIK